jgi:hypothetical protein
MQIPTTSGGRTAGYRIGSDQSAGIPAPRNRRFERAVMAALGRYTWSPSPGCRRQSYKQRRALRAAGAARVIFFYALDTEGMKSWFWALDPAEDKGPAHGPFASEREAKEDVRTTLFGKRGVTIDDVERQPTDRLQ